jgi:hypothetical protein
MSDQPENLMLVYLRRLDAKMDQIVDTLGDHGRRLTALEVAVSNLAATEASHYANTMLRIDGLSDRITRVERRLDLREEA